MIRTPSCPSTAVAAWASASASARAARKSSRPRRSRPSTRLVLGGQPHQLAHVGEAGLPLRAHQHGQVVAGLGHGGVDQPGEGEQRGSAAQRRQRLGEAAQQFELAGRDLRPGARGRPAPRSPISATAAIAGQMCRPRPAAARSSQSVSGVTPQAGEARAPSSAWSSSGLASAASSAQTSRDLLLRPVAAAADDVGAQARALERVLVRVEVGEGAQQHDHRAARDAGVGELAQARGERGAPRPAVRAGVRASVAGFRSIPSSSQPSWPVSSSSTAGRPRGAP